MWLFWIVAGALAVATVALVVSRAAAAARSAAAGPEDPTLPLYRRQLSEIDDLATRGLLGDEERRAAHAEAGRRLLAAADRGGPGEAAGGRSLRLTVLGASVTALLVAAGLYGWLGSPGDPDQPYRSRVAAWRADPSRLQPAEMAAVLRLLVTERPNDPQAYEFLGRAELAAGDGVAAAQAFRKAAARSPERAELQVMLGEALVSAGPEGATPAEAEAAFRKALALEPGNLPARYFLARAQITGGDRAAGLAAWKAIQAELPEGDPRRSALETDMAQATGGQVGGSGVDAAAAGLAASGQPIPDQAAFIRGMVGRLAARLETTPDDPEGWARLVRAYGVLGDKTAQTAALERARRLFAGRPADLARVEAEARGGVSR